VDAEVPHLSPASVCKRFGAVVAVGDVGVEATRSELLGVMGPNWAVDRPLEFGKVE